jgi:molybdopterin molybdotransferase
MIRIEEAYNVVTGAVEPMPVERTGILNALHRVLAEDVISDVDMPPFDKSAMDGYACRAADLDQPLSLIETIPAGKAPQLEISPGTCAEIMTGAPVPMGADCVIKVEDTHTDGMNRIIFTGKPGKTNISFRAEDVACGDLLLKKGTFLEPRHLAILASAGYASPLLAVRPSVAIISTGDEIVEPHEQPGLSKIRNSNAYQLFAQVLKCGALPAYMGIAPDEEQATFELLSKAVDKHELTIITGGISMGKFDFIPRVFEKMGVEILFRTLAVQPGKPTLFGRIGKKRIFGLPGNPVSAFNTFDMLVKPYLRLSMGSDPAIKTISLPMGVRYSRRKSERDSFIPVIIKEGKVYPLEYHGSGHLFSLSMTDGFIKIPMGTTSLEEGVFTDVRQI